MRSSPSLPRKRSGYRMEEKAYILAYFCVDCSWQYTAWAVAQSSFNDACCLGVILILAVDLPDTEKHVFNAD